MEDGESSLTFSCPYMSYCLNFFAPFSGSHYFDQVAKGSSGDRSFSKKFLANIDVNFPEVGKATPIVYEGNS